jgi:hypothetical protein
MTHTYVACLQPECRNRAIWGTSGVLLFQSTVDALPVDDTESEEGPSALSILALDITTCFMKWISDFFTPKSLQHRA